MQQTKTYVPAVSAAEMSAGAMPRMQQQSRTDWSGEISPPARPRPPMDTGMGGMAGDGWNQLPGGMQNRMQGDMMPDRQSGKEKKRNISIMKSKKSQIHSKTKCGSTDKPHNEKTDFI